jgi:NADP-reducing hydrogenase subunit HndC
MELVRSHILVCGGTGCTSSNSEKIIEELQKSLQENNLDKEVRVIRTGCFGLCAMGPIVVVYPEGAFYAQVKPEDAKEIVTEHILKGRIVKRLLYTDSKETETKKSLNEMDFYKKQVRIALRNCGVIDPENIDEYIAFDGYQALANILTKMKPEDVIDTMKKSGLRGTRRRGLSYRYEVGFCGKVG